MLSFFGYMMLVVLSLSVFGLILTMILAFIDYFILDGNLSSNLKRKFKKLFRVA